MRYLIPLLIVAGCASVNPQQFPGPNGRDAYTMACSGMGRSLHDCYTAASQLCPGGYDIIDARSSVAAVGTASGGIVAAPRYSLAVECR